MDTCINCGLDKVDPNDTARYHVLHPAFDPEVDPLSKVGPYCKDCFKYTSTGRAEAEAATEL